MSKEIDECGAAHMSRQYARILPVFPLSSMIRNSSLILQVYPVVRLLLFVCGLLVTLHAAEPFSVIVLPDTQNYVKGEGAAEKFLAQTKWIKENVKALNIKAVIHEGDITDDNSPGQWAKAKASLALLDGVIAWVPCVGNHDIGHNGPATSLLSEYFPEAELAKARGWGGKMPGADCFWYEFEGGGQSYLILSLNLGPSDAMLEWADGIIASHPDHQVIMVTHEYVGKDGALSTKDTTKNATAYGKHADGSSRNPGQDVWEKHVRKHKNYLMVLNGHYDGIAARNAMKGDHGNTVHQMMANYQYSPGGGNGFLRILRFLPDEKTCHVETYSPFLDERLGDDANTFRLDVSN